MKYLTSKLCLVLILFAVPAYSFADIFGLVSLAGPIDKSFVLHMPTYDAASKGHQWERAETHSFFNIVNGYTVAVYDKNDKRVQDIYHKAKGKVIGRADYAYDNKGKLTAVEFIATKTVISFTNNATSANRTTPPITRDKKQLSSKYHYGGSGEIVKVEFFNTRKKLSYYYDYVYNADGQVTNVDVSNSKGKHLGYYTLEYDAKGKVVRGAAFNGDNLKAYRSYTFNYDDEGRLTKAQTLAATKTILKTVNFSY